MGAILMWKALFKINLTKNVPCYKFQTAKNSKQKLWRKMVELQDNSTFLPKMLDNSIFLPKMDINEKHLK